MKFRRSTWRYPKAAHRDPVEVERFGHEIGFRRREGGKVALSSSRAGHHIAHVPAPSIEVNDHDMTCADIEGHHVVPALSSTWHRKDLGDEVTGCLLGSGPARRHHASVRRLGDPSDRLLPDNDGAGVAILDSVEELPHLLDVGAGVERDNTMGAHRCNVAMRNRWVNVLHSSVAVSTLPPHG